MCDSPLGVRFPPGSPPWVSQAAEGQLPGVTPEVLKEVRAGHISKGMPWSLPVHPTQLYSALDGFILVALLSAYYPLRRRDGEVMALLMVTYPVTRFLVEYLRSDEGVFFAGLTVSQNLSIVTLLAGGAFWYQLRGVSRKGAQGRNGRARKEDRRVILYVFAFLRFAPLRRNSSQGTGI